MIVKKLKELQGTEREIEAPNGNWVSRRFLLKDEGMGFSMHDTIIRAGTTTYIWYKNHLEAVYCVGGRGKIEDLSDGKIHEIEDGTLYALNGHEKHYLTAYEDMRMVCVFNPPLSGKEVHDKDGVYPVDDN